MKKLHVKVNYFLLKITWFFMSISLPEVFSVMSVHNFNEKKIKFEETESLTAQSKTD